MEMGLPEEQLISAYLEAYNRHDADNTTSFFAEDCLYEDIALGGVIRGPEGVRRALQSIAGTDLSWRIDRLFSTTESACVEWTMSGTHTFTWLRYPPTGKRFSIRGVTAIDLTGRKSKRNSDYWDFASLLRHVGLLAAPST